MAKWQSLTQHPEVVQFFAGLMEHVGIRITDTGEAFTCHHRGSHIDFEPALDPAKVDYTVDISTAQVDRLAAHAETGRLDDAEQYRIVSTLFTPATAATLKHGILAHPLLRRLAGAERVIHVHLVPPAPGLEAMQHTLVYADRQWLVFPGLHGRAGRTYRLSLADALEYHRRVFQAVKVNRSITWLKFSLWYRTWRKGVSERDGRPVPTGEPTPAK
jgi:hypothetical protein